VKIGILGGGLAGLAVGAACRAHDCEVLEADSTIGGHCRSLVESGYTFDLGGPHILFSRDQDILAQLHRRLGANLAMRRRNNRIWYDGRFVKYPFENGLYDLSPQDRFECLYYYLHNDYPRPVNFKEWIYHVFGKGIAEKYMIPYNEKIWNVPAEQMAIDWVDGRVPRPPVEDVIKSAVGVETEGYTHQLNFGYPVRGGIEALPRAFADECRAIVTGFPVRRLWREGGRWLVSDGGRERAYDRVVSTIPLQDLAAALPEVPRRVRAAIDGLRFNSLIVVMLGVVAPQPHPFTALYIPDPRFIFHRLSFPLSFTANGAPAGREAIAAEITTNPGDGVHELSDAEVERKTIDGLETMGLLKRGAVEFARTHRTRHAYVVRTFDYREKLALALEYMDSLGIVSVGRNAEFEYINMDEAVRRAFAVAARLDGRIESAAP
jgi:protoporphyrinogen oxidase